MLFPAAGLLKDHLVRSANRTIGVLPHRPDSLVAMAQHLRDAFAQANVDVVLDIGAGRGGYRDFLRRWVGFSGPIVSFEPSRPDALFLMNRARHDEDWFVRDYGLWDEDATKLIEVPTEDLSTLEVRYERVSLHRLDSVMPELKRRLGFSRYFVKLDSLARDPRIIEGGQDSLGAACGVQLELAVTGLYNGVPAFSDTVTELRRMGFSASGLFVAPKERRQRGADFDCVMLRDVLTEPRSTN